MKTVIVIGSGISGLTCAIECASKGIGVTLVSPYPSERAQSVLAAGGINAVLESGSSEDTVGCHISDTLKGGVDIAGEDAVSGLCSSAPDIVRWLEKLGTVFSREDGEVARRAFGGQSYNRTCYCGASTGKQIVTALVMEARRYECKGLITRMNRTHFYSALIRDGKCYGAVVYNEDKEALETVTAGALIMATGGMNSLYGKTTGSRLNDGYAAGRLFMQGADLKNLEFIQYHPTTITTVHKKMLVSEAARGEGGRLYYLDGDKRVYFMEDKFGPRGNLMPRDVVTRCIYETGRQVYLDVSFLGKKKIMERIPEVSDLCAKYYGIDIAKESIPVSPSVHFFMGGIAVDNRHETNIKGLLAVGECASIYHGANRLGGNSLLAAVYSGRKAAETVAEGPYEDGETPDFTSDLEAARKELADGRISSGSYEDSGVLQEVADIMNGGMGIVREEKELSGSLEKLDALAEKVRAGDKKLLSYLPVLVLAKASVICARSRKESRGAHLRSDYPSSSEEYKCATVISYNGGKFDVTHDREGRYES